MSRAFRFCLVLSVLAGAALLSVAATTPPAWQPVVRVYGAMRNFMMGTDMGGKITLAKLPSSNLYALGVAADLRGELLTWNGATTLTTVLPAGKTSTRPAPVGTQAALLVSAQVPRWQAISVPAALRGLPELERLVARTAAQRGLDTTQPLPFRLSGRPLAVRYHVMDWPRPAAQHTMQDHKKYAVQGQFGPGQPVEILGFFSRNHQSVFTHHTTFLHMHARPAGQAFAAHVDSLRFGPDAATLYLPAR
jgi:acetolactate decarboxylase